MSEEVKVERKKRSLSLIQPTSIPTLGNYLGAMKGWSAFQEEYDTIYGVADLHSITVRQDPQKLRRQTTELYAMLLALGLDPDKGIVFIQSHVPTHSQLGWLLNCYTQFGELSRMTQFKDKSKQHADNVNARAVYLSLPDGGGYSAVSVGYCAGRCGPKAAPGNRPGYCRAIQRHLRQGVYRAGSLHSQERARVMSLQDPTRKMSKSDPNPKGTVYLTDEPGVIMKKFRSAVTDSEMSVHYGEGKDGINNLMTIYAAVTGKTMDAIEQEFAGKGYGDFKTAVGEAVIAELEPVQQRFNQFMQDKSYLQACWTKGADLAQRVSQRTLDKAMKKIGFFAEIKNVQGRTPAAPARALFIFFILEIWSIFHQFFVNIFLGGFLPLTCL